VAEVSWYHSERENLGWLYLGVEPAWYGEPLAEPADLGEHLAADPRYTSCAARSMLELLLRRPLALEDTATLLEVQASFEQAGGSSHDLLRAVLATEAWAAGAGEGDGVELSTGRMMSDSMLASAVEDLTGFRWKEGELDLMINDEEGLRVLAGGVDGVMVNAVLLRPALSRALVLKRLSELAGGTVARDLQDRGSAELLPGLSITHQPADPEFGAALDALIRRAWGRAPQEDELEELLALWEAVEAEQDAGAAWAATVAAVLRDPEFWIY
jgi:Protein of unknown function (DUF1585)